MSSAIESFSITEPVSPAIPNKTIYAKDFLNQFPKKNAIQHAVDECARQGGGTVVVTPGEWESGPIHLHSKIQLQIEKDAKVTFSSTYSDYLPVVFTRWEGTECYNYSPLIYAKDCTDLAITGEGTLLGNGAAWWKFKQTQQTAAERLAYAEGNNIPVEKRIFGTEEDGLRPSFIQMISCKNILMEGIKIMNGPQWTLHPVYCEDVTVRGVKVITEGPNTDGLNPDSCKNVLIEDCYFKTGDDCIAINSGLNEDGWRVGRPCENIHIRNCTMKGGHGGIAIGSAISGGVQNVWVENCKISGTNQGIRLKSMRGRGGYVKNICFDGIEINEVQEEAIQINMFYEYSTVLPKSKEPTQFEQIHIKNSSGSGAKVAIQMKGLPECPLESIYFEHIQLEAASSFVCSDVGSIRMDGVQLLETKV